MNKYHAAKAISSFGNILEINGTDINIYFAIIGFPVTLGLNYYTGEIHEISRIWEIQNIY